MDGISCDRCGEGLLLHENVRYVLKWELYAAYDPMEITSADLAGDLDAEWDRAVEAAKSQSPSELASQVHVENRFDLCDRCRRVLLRDPLQRGDLPDLESR